MNTSTPEFNPALDVSYAFENSYGDRNIPGIIIENDIPGTEPPAVAFSHDAKFLAISTACWVTVWEQTAFGRASCRFVFPAPERLSIGDAIAVWNDGTVAFACRSIPYGVAAAEDRSVATWSDTATLCSRDGHDDDRSDALSFTSIDNTVVTAEDAESVITWSDTATLWGCDDDSRSGEHLIKTIDGTFVSASEALGFLVFTGSTPTDYLCLGTAHFVSLQATETASAPIARALIAGTSNGEVRYLHPLTRNHACASGWGDSVRRVAVTPDERWLVVCTRTGDKDSLCPCDISSEETKCRGGPHPNAPRKCLDFQLTQDTTRLAVAWEVEWSQGGRTGRFWEVLTTNPEDVEEVSVIEVPSTPRPRVLLASPRFGCAAYASGNVVTVVENMTERFELRHDAPTGGAIAHMAFSADGEWLATATDWHDVRLWYLRARQSSVVIDYGNTRVYWDGVGMKGVRLAFSHPNAGTLSLCVSTRFQVTLHTFVIEELVAILRRKAARASVGVAL